MAVLSSKLWSVVLSCALTLMAQGALAAPTRAVDSVGPASLNVLQRGDLPNAPTLVAPGTPLGSGASASPDSSSLWNNVVGGAATALGLVWLASSLGFGEAFAQLLLLGFVAVALLAVAGFLRSRRGGASAGLTFQAAGAGAADGADAGRGGSQLDPLTPRGYSSKNVGNDASARPWEQYPPLPEQKAPAEPSGGAPGWGVPEGFDTAGFLKASKTNFVSLQAAWDRSDIAALRAMMTDGMLEQIRVQLAEREQIQGEAANQTDVVMLEARLLGIEEVGDAHLASVEFSGLIREDASAGPNPFREIWNITRTKSGPGGWLVAGVQALQ